MPSTNNLPSLKAIKVFEAAARLLSFSAAAKELHVTQSAVSHQIKALECHLGKSLFIRANNSVHLTQYGDIYFSVIKDSFRRIQIVTDHLMDSRDIELKVIAQSSFAIGWLAQNLTNFHNLYPNINISLAMTTNAEHYDPAEFDISIGTWLAPVNYKSQLIRKERWYPVCSLATSFKIHEVNAISLLEFPLCSSENGQDWKLWMQKHNIDPSIKLNLQHVSHTLLAEKSVLDGERLALSCDFIAQNDIDDGKLTAFKHLSYSPSWGNYYIHYHSGSHHIDKINIFLTWLINECQQEQRH